MKRIRWRAGPAVWVVASIAVVALGSSVVRSESSDKALAEQILAALAAPRGSSSPPASSSLMVPPAGPASSATPAAPAASSAAPSVSSAAPQRPAFAEPVEQAKSALERAASARRAGDVQHAEMLEGLAREWAETARDLARTVQVETTATAEESAAAQALLRAERARALLEEAISRRGRAESELERLSASAGPFPPKPPPAPGLKGKAAPRPAATPASSARGAK